MNEKRLRQVMKDQKVSAGEMCAVLKISRSAFYRKSRGISEFTQSEIQKMVDYLHLNSPVSIF